MTSPCNTIIAEKQVRVNRVVVYKLNQRKVCIGVKVSQNNQG